MNRLRRRLIKSPLGLLGATALAQAGEPSPPPAMPGAPPTFNSGPTAGPPVTAQTFAEAEKLMRVTLTQPQREMAAQSWPSSMAGLMARRTGPRALALDDTDAPASVWNPLLGGTLARGGARFVRSRAQPAPLPENDADIAFAPLSLLSRWIESRALSSERLTRLYLDRIGRFDSSLRAFITVTGDLALKQAVQADREIAQGRYRGPLHGVPYGVKDLLDTAGIRTTWGAEPLRSRVPAHDATVMTRLHAAGAVLLGKLSLGALALNDVWFGGQTMNPWVPEEGSGGSSAGPGAATSAGLVGFSIGSETGGSIIGPSMRCGVTGLRPTFGRVPRTGAMTLCWSLDKLGVMSRGVEDALIVLRSIEGPDGRDVSAVAAPLVFDARAPIKGLRLGYVPAWMQQEPATDVDRQSLELARNAGLVPAPVSLPDWPYETLNAVLFAESAASFEAWAEDGRFDQLRMQVPDAWPNVARQARFISAVDLVQADRLRRRVAHEMARVMREVDVFLVPSLRDDILTISNHSGHPSLTIRTGMVEISEARSDWAPDPERPLPKFSPPRRAPHGITLLGRLFDEGTLTRVGLALEQAAGVSALRPPGF